MPLRDPRSNMKDIDTLRSVSAWSSGAGHEGTKPNWLPLVEKHLQANFCQPIRVHQLANNLGLTEAQVSRRFRRQFGVTIGAYVRCLRVEWACSALTSGEGSLAEIAARAGFADQSHFTRVFRRHTGTTPKRFRDDCARREERVDYTLGSNARQTGR